MSVVANSLRGSIRTIQIIMIGAGLVGAVVASDYGEELGEGPLFFLNHNFGMEKVENLGDETKDKNESSGSEETTLENNFDAQNIFSTDNLMLKPSDNDKELAQPSIIRVLRTLQGENDKLKDEHAKMMDLLENAIKQHAEVKLSLEKIDTERNDFKNQLERATKQNQQLIKRDNDRSFKNKAMFAVGGIFSVLYIISGAISYSSPSDTPKFDL